MSIIFIAIMMAIGAAAVEWFDVIREKREERKHWHEVYTRREREKRERDAYAKRRGLKYSWN